MVDISIGQRQGLRWGSDERPDEKISHCPSKFDNLPSTDELTSGKAKQNISKHAQSILLELYDGLGHVLAVGGGSIQQHTTLNNGYQSFPDANRQVESNASNFLVPRIRRPEEIARSLREGGDQEATKVERFVQKEHSTGTDETTEEV